MFVRVFAAWTVGCQSLEQLLVFDHCLHSDTSQSSSLVQDGRWSQSAQCDVRELGIDT